MGVLLFSILRIRFLSLVRLISQERGRCQLLLWVEFLHAIIESMKELKKTLITFTAVQLHSYLATQALDIMLEIYVQLFYSCTFENERDHITVIPLFAATQQEPTRRPMILVK